MILALYGRWLFHCLLRYHLYRAWNRKKASHKTRVLCEEWYSSQWKCFDVALYKTTKYLLFLLPSFHSERLDTEPWMAFLEAELDSEDLESYSQIGSLEKLTLLRFVVAEKAKFNSEKMGRNKIGRSCFPYSRIWLSFPTQPFQSGRDEVTASVFFFSEAL